MMEYIILVYLSHKDSKGLSEGKCKKAMTNALKVTQIFWLEEKQNKTKQSQSRSLKEKAPNHCNSYRFVGKCYSHQKDKKEKANTQIILTEK